MVDAWISCNNCGKRYGTFLSNCPQCGQKSSASRKKMGKWKKVGIIASIVVVAWVTINLSIYYSNPQVKAKVDTIANSVGQTNPNDIIGIVDFAMYRDGSIYRVDFGLSDKDLNMVASDAKVSFMVRNYTFGEFANNIENNKITKDNGHLVYSKDFNIRATDFKEYGTGQEYRWVIDGQELKDVGLYSVILTVTLPNGKSFTATN